MSDIDTTPDDAAPDKPKADKPKQTSKPKGSLPAGIKAILTQLVSGQQFTEEGRTEALAAIDALKED